MSQCDNNEPSQDDALAAQEQDSALQTVYVDKLMATYRANLVFLCQHFKDVFDKVMAVELEAPFEVGTNGRLKIYSGRFVGSMAEHVRLSSMLYQLFDDPCTRPSVDVTSGFLNDPNEAVAYDPEHPMFYRQIEPRFRLELIELFRQRCPSAAQRLPKPYYGHRKLPLTLVFGTGYGWQLDRLVDDYEIRHLIIVDPEVARFNLSLYFVDYVALYQRFQAKGMYFSIVLNEDPAALSEHLLALIYHYWPPYLVQGAGLFFQAYDSELVKKLWAELNQNIWKLYRGWGFLDDEMLGLKHAAENTRYPYPVYSSKPTIPPEAVAFIVGNGPSLDTLLPTLRQWREHAVVFCCGSAVTALAQAGIKPDYHIEIERTEITYRVLVEALPRGWLRDVPIMGLNVLPPAVFTLTEQPLLLLKSTDLGACIADWDKEYPRIGSGPTCTNTGLSLALHMGFQQIYLLGVDAGFRDSSYHHAKSSLYYAEKNAMTPTLATVVETADALSQSPIPVPGNFGGEVLSIPDLTYVRDAIAHILLSFPAARVFNLNDGAAINGAEPLRPQTLHLLDAAQASRKAAKAAICQAFTVPSQLSAECHLHYLAEQTGAIALDLQRVLKRPLHNRMDIVDALYDMHHYFFVEAHRATQVFPLVRGSMLHMGRFLLDASMSIRDDASVLEYANAAFELLLRFLHAAKDNILSLADAAAVSIAAEELVTR